MLNFRRRTRSVCCRCRNRRSYQLVVIVWCFGVFFFVWFTYKLLEDRVSQTIRAIKCSNEESENFLQQLVSQNVSVFSRILTRNSTLQCVNYTRGLASGSLCYPLCTGEIHYIECLGHGVKPHVLKASWKGKDIILKVKRMLYEKRVMKHFTEDSPPFKVFDRTYFDINVNLSYINFILNADTIVDQKVLDYIYKECAGEDGVLTYHEMGYCFTLLESDEFLLSVLLQDTHSIPDLYGTCGSVFGVEHISTELLETLSRLIRDERSWITKAKLGLALLDMIERLDKTPYGTLYLCDVQFPNFGVHELDSGYLVKPIDVDIAWLTAQMKQVMVDGSRVECKSDDDCNFISCLSKCNPDTHHCDPYFYSNNLIVSFLLT